MTLKDASARRSSLLDPLFRPVSALHGIGPRIAKLVEKLTGPYVLHLLLYNPNSYAEREKLSAPDAEYLNKLVILPFTALQYRPGAPKRSPTRILGVSGHEHLELSFFHANLGYLKRLCPEGVKLIVSGELGLYSNTFQIVHPDHIVRAHEEENIPLIETRYPLSAGITNKILNKAVIQALALLPALQEWIEPSLKQRKSWPNFDTALHALHRPHLYPEVSLSKSKERLAYDELFANQLALQILRRVSRKIPAQPLEGTHRLQDQLSGLLPFNLTGDQTQAIAQISADLKKPERMMRLLQGDVGAGKTVVALYAMVQAVESGAQAVLMAPTSILAQQHFHSIVPYAEKLGLKALLLTGKDKLSQKRESQAKIAKGEAQIIVGTHALFQDKVTFMRLGLAIIDEQHRFGVDQRLRLGGKGESTHILLMTATPIPRTLLLAGQGDLDCSILREKPPGRKEIKTIVKPLRQIDNVIEALKRALEGGAKAYWVCPLIDESEALDLASVKERFASLKSHFGNQAELIHGRLGPEDKEAAMQRFAYGDARLLVATSVIEVGVDVPEASIMVIEQAERFGLSQLHQLRGRIGRGDVLSTCILLYGHPLGKTSEERLRIMRESNDGFFISEQDMKLRGAGEVLGTRQSGVPNFRFGGLEHYDYLIGTANEDARLLIETDAALSKTSRGLAARALLALFERGEAAKYLLHAG